MEHQVIFIAHDILRRCQWNTQNEIFEDCVIDIQTAVDFAHKQGFTRIVLQGHSYGCNKVTFYALEKKYDGKIILLAPCDLGDISRPTTKARDRNWKANDPNNYDMFRYKDKTFMTALAKIKNDILVEIGTADKYITQPNKQDCLDYLVTAFKSAKVTGHLIKDADHNYTDKYKQVADNVTAWLGCES